MKPIAIAVNRRYTGKLAQDDKRWGDHTTSFVIEVLDVSGIADTIRGGYAIAAAHHTRRGSDNFISAQHIGLDFDTETDESRIENVLTLPLISEHAAIVHATSSHKPDKPRCRALFILDEPVRDARTYASYAVALVWKLSQVDRKCTDAARLWFGAKDCDMVVRPDKVLPVQVLEALAQEHEQHLAEQAREIDLDQTIDVDEALQRAIAASADGRNDAGFWLACRLRDSGRDKAESSPVMRLYQSVVQNAGDHEYTLDEAMASLKSAYSRRPRGHSNEQVEKDLSLFEWFAWHESLGTKQGATHYSLQSIMHVAEVARLAGRTQGLELACRDFISVGVKKNTALNHIKAMCNVGLLVMDRKSDTRRGNRYSINVELLRSLALGRSEQATQSFDVAQSQPYRDIARLAYFVQGARIDNRLWTTKPPTETFGPACQRLIAVLAMSSQSTLTPVQKELSASPKRVSPLDKQGQSSQALLVCPTVTPISVSSKAKLFELANVSERVGKRKLKLLEQIGIVTCENSDVDVRTKIPSLVEDWYERLIGIEPTLTTFGDKEIAANRYDSQRVSYHSKVVGFVRDADKQKVCDDTVKQASERQSERSRTLDAMRARRLAWARKHGIAEVPDLGDDGKPLRKKIEQPVVATPAQAKKKGCTQKTERGFGTRAIIPEGGTSKRNQQTDTEKHRRLDALLATPSLWANELDEVKLLSAALNVKVKLERIELVM